MSFCCSCGVCFPNPDYLLRHLEENPDHREVPEAPNWKDVTFLIGGLSLVKSLKEGFESGKFPEFVDKYLKVFIETICRYPQSIMYLLLSYLGFNWALENKISSPHVIGPACALVALHGLNAFNPAISVGSALFLFEIGLERIDKGFFKSVYDWFEELKPEKPEKIPQEAWDQAFVECQAEGAEGGSIFLACLTVKLREKGYEVPVGGLRLLGLKGS